MISICHRAQIQCQSKNLLTLFAQTRAQPQEAAKKGISFVENGKVCRNKTLQKCIELQFFSCVHSFYHSHFSHSCRRALFVIRFKLALVSFRQVLRNFQFNCIHLGAAIQNQKRFQVFAFFIRIANFLYHFLHHIHGGWMHVLEKLASAISFIFYLVISVPSFNWTDTLNAQRTSVFRYKDNAYKTLMHLWNILR